MKRWLIPAIVLLVVAGAGMGVGWSLNEWRDGDEAPVRSEQPVRAGPTQAELDAQRCAAALEAAGEAVSGGPKVDADGRASYPQVPRVINQAVARYCH